MKLIEFFRAQLDREAKGTRKALERVPEGRNDWKPHAKSMELGYLASLVARMPSWIAMTINTEEFNLDPQARPNSSFTPSVQTTTADLLKLLDASVAEAHAALSQTTDEHLMKPWRFKVAGRLVSERSAARRDQRLGFDSPGAPSRAVDRVSASERCERSGDLRAFGGRADVAIPALVARTFPSASLRAGVSALISGLLVGDCVLFRT